MTVVTWQLWHDTWQPWHDTWQLWHGQDNRGRTAVTWHMKAGTWHTWQDIRDRISVTGQPWRRAMAPLQPRSLHYSVLLVYNRIRHTGMKIIVSGNSWPRLTSLSTARRQPSNPSKWKSRTRRRSCVTWTAAWRPSGENWVFCVTRTRTSWRWGSWLPSKGENLFYIIVSPEVSRKFSPLKVGEQPSCEYLSNAVTPLCQLAHREYLIPSGRWSEIASNLATNMCCSQCYQHPSTLY